MYSTFQKNPSLTVVLRNYIERKLKRFGSPEYAYTVVNKKNPSKILIISSYPKEWVNMYLENHFQHIDPVVLVAFKRTAPFSWDENITLTNEISFSKIFSVSREYNILNGFTFVLHDCRDNVALLSFIIKSDKDEAVEDIIENEKANLQMALIEIYEHMNKMIKAQRHRSGRTSSDGVGAPMFTERENQILYWASMGKTYSEIGTIYGISVRTVKFHMGNLVNKLGVNNARQAIRLGVEMGLITPNPA
ncbi:LuxR family transcriptional regulator [Erwinia sp. HR93]|uniref:helix-turn-helix transcriptional regulator n=1 Tax=Erwinia sp. HR93 TaxID=3094840 RepID=UPI002ADEB491|nr:LuxR family transcriptional regulator [Erwinia sp. HR93]MEA1064438.1 LuxR family transcriptional regulator [Erwinia sp. HR93]